MDASGMDIKDVGGLKGPAAISASGTKNSQGISLGTNNSFENSGNRVGAR
jgi:hypothetical protein